MVDDKQASLSLDGDDANVLSSTGARQRRIQRRRVAGKSVGGTKRVYHDSDDESYEEFDDDDDSSVSSSTKGSTKPSKKKPRSSSATNSSSQDLSSIRGIKKQARYEPEVPMAKSELAAWRKEARRVRNRESAAASRNKTRQRIEELEGQVAELQAQCAKLLQQLEAKQHDEVKAGGKKSQGRVANKSPSPELEAATNTATNCVSPLLSSSIVTLSNVVVPPPHWSLPQQQAAQALADSVVVPTGCCSEDDEPTGPKHEQKLLYPSTHQNIMISRPIAI